MTSADELHSEEVATWLRQYLQLKQSVQVTPRTRINDDLGVAGDDGIELVQAFGKQFSVDVSGFPCSKYFGEEAGATPVGLALALWRRVVRGKWSSLQPLYVQDLAALIGTVT